MQPIRVLQIVTYMGRGGLETMLMNYYRHVDRSKVQFDFLVHRDFEADYDKEILKLGGKIYRVPRLIPWSRKYKQRLKEFFMEHPEYKIVHVHQDCLSSVALQCAKESDVPVRIAHSHSSSQDKNIKYLIKKHYMKKIPLYATDHLACGKRAGDWMFGGHPYEVVPNAVDVEKYVYSPEKAEQVRNLLGVGKELVIGHVGRFDFAKNQDFLVDIFAECEKIVSGIKLLLIGDGDGKKEIESKVQHLGLKDKVIFTGVRTDVNELLQAMDIFVFPSLYEGLGIAAIEAQAAGLPCVVSDHVPQECKVTEYVEFLSLKLSPKKWAECIIKHIGDERKDQYDAICKAGYDINESAVKLENFYLGKREKNEE